MPIMVTQDDGTEVEAFTKDEVEAQTTAKVAEVTKTVREQVEAEFGTKLSEKDKEIETQRRLIQSKGKSIEDLKKIVEDKDSKFSETERTLAQLQIDAQQTAEKQEAEKRTTLSKKRTALISQIAGGNNDIEKAITDNYNLINIEETDDESITKRMEIALRMTEGVASESFSLGGSGKAPIAKKKDEDFSKTEKGAKIYKRMGF